MKTPAVQEIKSTLKDLRDAELTALILRLARFKKENKELLSYLLFSAADETQFVRDVKSEIDLEFENVNKHNLYLAKKTLRKILRLINKYSRYSNVTQTEIELRIYYCRKLNDSDVEFRRSQVLLNLYNGQVKKIQSILSTLHEDLQFDFADDVLALEI